MGGSGRALLSSARILSVVPAQRGRQLRAAGSLQYRSADGEHRSHTGETCSSTATRCCHTLQMSQNRCVATLSRGHRVGCGAVPHGSECAPVQVLPKLSSSIVHEIDSILGNKPYSKKDYRS